MKKMLLASKRFMKDESGVTTIEYALIGALVAVALIATLKIVAGDIDTVLKKIGTALTAA